MHQAFVKISFQAKLDPVKKKRLRAFPSARAIPITTLFMTTYLLSESPLDGLLAGVGKLLLVGVNG